MHSGFGIFQNKFGSGYQFISILLKNSGIKKSKNRRNILLHAVTVIKISKNSYFVESMFYCDHLIIFVSTSFVSKTLVIKMSVQM